MGHFLLPIAALALGVAAGLVSPQGQLPDVAGPIPHALGAAMWFGFWALSVLCWGKVLRRALAPRAPALLAEALLGTAWASLVAAALGHLGLVGPSHRLLLGLIVAAGALGAIVAPPARAKPRPKAPRATGAARAVELAETAAPFAAVALFVLMAVAPQGHPDPLYYNLVGPRLWAEQGRIVFPPELVFLYQCTSWDYLGIWAQSFLAGPDGRGLIEAQLFMQWAHALFGAGGTALALAALLRGLTSSRGWLNLAVAAGVSAASVSWTAWLAKNDLGAAFWVLGGAALLLDNEADTRAAALGAFVVGLGLTAKFTAAFLVLPLAALVALREGRRKKRGTRLAALAVAGLAGAAPVLVSNLLRTGNPFFPALDRVFQSGLLSPALRAHFDAFEGGGLHFSAEDWGKRVLLLLKQSPFILAFLALPLAWRGNARSSSRLRPLWLVTTAATALFLFAAGRATSLRLAGPVMPLLCALGVLAAAELLRKRASLPLAHAAALGLVAWSAGVPWVALRSFVEFPAAPRLIQENSPSTSYPPEGGAAMAWLRAHAGKDELILLPDDNRIYYLSFLRTACVSEDPSLQRTFSATTGWPATLTALRALGVRYVLSMPSWETGWESRLRETIDHAALVHREAVAFTDGYASVIDIAMFGPVQ